MISSQYSQNGATVSSKMGPVYVAGLLLVAL